MYRVGTTFDDLFAETVAFLSRLGVLVSQGDRLHVGRERHTLHFFADLLRPYLEAYRATAVALLGAPPAAAVDPRALARAALEHARASYAAGRLELRESVSKATIENAVAWLVQQGGAAREGDAAATIDAAWRSETLPEVVREIARHLAS
jgi:glycerol-3-phosphate O-acyltransferase